MNNARRMNLKGKVHKEKDSICERMLTNFKIPSSLLSDLLEKQYQSSLTTPVTPPQPHCLNSPYLPTFTSTLSATKTVMRQLNTETEHDFEEKDIDRTFDLLKEKFGFNIQAWREQFENYFMQHATRKQTRTEFFLLFGNEYINPVLNKILGRRAQFPTFNRMVEYVVKRK